MKYQRGFRLMDKLQKKIEKKRSVIKKLEQEVRVQRKLLQELIIESDRLYYEEQHRMMDVVVP